MPLAERFRFLTGVLRVTCVLISIIAAFTASIAAPPAGARSAIPVPAMETPPPFEGAIIYAFYMQAMPDGVK